MAAGVASWPYKAAQPSHDKSLSHKVVLATGLQSTGCMVTTHAVHKVKLFGKSTGCCRTKFGCTVTKALCAVKKTSLKTN